MCFTRISSIYCFLICVANLLCNISPLVVGFKECKFPAIINFGDSNSDTGAYSAALFPLPLPYGRTYFHYPSGRFSDGRLIIDFIAEKLELPFLHAYLDSVGADFRKGVNFAIAGATTTLENRTTVPLTGLTPFYLTIEFRQYTRFRSIFPNNQGNLTNAVAKVAYFHEALYTVDIGQNNIGGLLQIGTPLDEIRDIIPSLVNELITHIKLLYGLGGRSFWIHNIRPIGCLAYILTSVPTQMDAAGCAIPVNDLVQYYNTLLKQSVHKLRLTLPLAAITYVDIYSITYSFFTQPQLYGFIKPLQVCCGIGGPYNYNSKVNCGIAPSCLDPSVKVNWDGIHLTERANQIIFQMISTGNFSDPPLPPALACQRFA